MSRRRKLRKSQDRREAKTESPSTSPAISYWVVAFLDLLGYRSVLERIDLLPLPTSVDGHAEISRDLGRAIKLRRRLNGIIDGFVKGATFAPSPELASLPSHARQLAESWRSVRTVRAAGPDHVVLATSLSPEPGHFPLRAVYLLVLTTAAAMLLQLSAGHDDPDDTLPLRGGIDIAPGALVAPEGILYSPALTRAYELESTTAVFPRAVVGERFADFLRSVVNDTDHSLEAAHRRDLARSLETMFFRDADGVLSLDFFGESVRRHFQDPSAAELAQQALTFVKRALEIPRVKANPHVVKKYEWLLDYMEPRRGLWTPRTA